MKKNTALHWRESQDMNYTRGKKMGIKLKRLLTCRFEKRGNKKLLKIVKKFGTASCLLHKVFKKCHRN